MGPTKSIIFGIHSVHALLESQPEKIQRLCVQKERHDKKVETILHLAKENGIYIEHLLKPALDKMTENANHQGVIAFCIKSRIYSENDIKPLLEKIEIPFVLILDGIQDPHNLGACFRSADAAGVHLIIAPKDKSAGITPIVSKVASGAAEKIPFVQATNLVRAMEELKGMGIWIYGAAAEASTTLFQMNLSGAVAIVLGAEGAGLRRLTREHCDGLIKIPMFGSVSSLNVSVAAGICLFEVVRQRINKR